MEQGKPDLLHLSSDRPCTLLFLRKLPDIATVTIKGRLSNIAQLHYILLMPTLIAIAFITIIPLVFTIYASLTDWHLFAYGVSVRFLGLRNFFKLFHDQNFIIAVRNTAFFATTASIMEYLIGLVVAIALNNATWGRRFFRTLFWLPLMIGSVAITLIVGRMMLDPYIGPVNTFVRWIGLEPIPWLADRRTAMFSIIFVDIWGATPFMIMMLLAGLQSIPTELSEAAVVDGASEWQVFRYITFPLLAPVSATVFLIRVVDAWTVDGVISSPVDVNVFRPATLVPRSLFSGDLEREEERIFIFFSRASRYFFH